MAVWSMADRHGCHGVDGASAGVCASEVCGGDDGVSSFRHHCSARSTRCRGEVLHRLQRSKGKVPIEQWMKQQAWLRREEKL